MKIIKLSEHNQYFMYGDEPEEIELVKNPNLLQKVGNILFLILTILGLIIIFSTLYKRKRYVDNINTELTFLSIGFICLIPAIVYYIWFKIKSKKENEENNERFNQFLSQLIKLKVNLKDVKIKQKSINQSTVIFIIPYPQENAVIHYKKDFIMEYSKILLWFIQQKETTFYINPEDINQSYLDLKFMNT